YVLSSIPIILFPGLPAYITIGRAAALLFLTSCFAIAFSMMAIVQFFWKPAIRPPIWLFGLSIFLAGLNMFSPMVQPILYEVSPKETIWIFVWVLFVLFLQYFNIYYISRISINLATLPFGLFSAINFFSLYV